jgi:hypothetical protein
MLGAVPDDTRWSWHAAVTSWHGVGLSPELVQEARKSQLEQSLPVTFSVGNILAITTSETYGGILCRGVLNDLGRDGYVEPVAEHTRFTGEEAKAYFDQMTANIRDPRGYAVWFVPVASARVP